MLGCAAQTALALPAMAATGPRAPMPRPMGASGDFHLVGDWTFGTGTDATVRDMAELSEHFHFRYIYDNGRLDRMPYEWSRHTSYPPGDARALHVFTPDALILKGRIPPGGGYFTGGIEAGLLRAKQVMRPGMYLELRARIPRGPGLLPAFWLIPGAQYGDRFELPPWPPEIDIFEFLQFNSRPRPTVMEANVETKGHPEQFGNPHDLFSRFQDRRWEPGTDFSAADHVFALDWVPGRPIWVVDGVPVKQTVYDWGDAPAHVLVSNQIGLTLNGVDVSGMKTQDRDWDFRIRHLRVWQRTA